MIRFDNGPPDGDYVRYIDELMAQRAAALVSATMTSNPDAVDRMRADQRRKNPTTSAAFETQDERARDAKSGAIVSAQPRASATYSSSPSPSSSDNSSQHTAALSPAAAAAIASAIMTGDNQRLATPVGTFVGAIAIAIGAVLILMGILGTTSNVLFIVAGIALVWWAIKRLGRSAAPPAAATAVDMFAAAPTRRASSHIGNKRK